MEHGGTKLKTVREESRRLNISIASIYKKIRSGEWPAYRCGRKLLLDEAEILDVMRAAAEEEE